MALLEVKNIYKSFGGVKAIQDFSLAADAGQIHGIIGPNGAGKTTIFNVISGVYPADQGSVTLNGQDITKIEQYKITRLGMGRTFQNIRLFKGLTVEENVMCAFGPAKPVFHSGRPCADAQTPRRGKARPRAVQKISGDCGYG